MSIYKIKSVSFNFLRSYPMLALSMVAFFVALASFLVPEEHRYIFVWTYFYVPFLWMFWIGSVFKTTVHRKVTYAIITWMFINFSILLTLISVTSESKDVEQSLGADVVMTFLYFPITVPSIVLSKILPFSMAHIIPNTEKKLLVGIVNIWLEMSIWAVFQSGLILFLARGRGRLMKTDFVINK